MSCACEHKKLASEYERMHRLAKMNAILYKKTVALYKNEDGTALQPRPKQIKRL
jgi:hypothetical protein